MTHRILLTSAALVCLLLLGTACQQVAVSGGRDGAKVSDSGGNEAATGNGVYGPPARLGVLPPKEVTESSGIVASRSTPGLFWTHNDSGDGPFLYAVDARGALKGVWRVAGATARDWEGIAAGPGPETGKNYLYIGDIGDNRGTRDEVKIHRVPEPLITTVAASSSKASPISTEEVETIRLRYPDGNYDAETLMVHPQSGNIYLVTKIPLGDPLIYEALAPLGAGKTITMNRVGQLSLPGFFGGLITGGDISPDGLRVALCDYDRGYELVLPPSSRQFNEVWKQTLTEINLGERKQGEAIGYRLDGRALLATSEGKRAPLIQVVRR